MSIRDRAEAPPEKARGAFRALGVHFWPLAFIRELDDALLHLRLNEPELGTLLFRTAGDPELVAAYDAFLIDHGDDWLVREISPLSEPDLETTRHDRPDRGEP